MRWLTCLILLLLAAPAFGDSIEGFRAYRSGDFAAARREFSGPPDSGPVGAFMRALMDLNGQGGALNRPAAIELLKQSADGGYSPAQFQLGSMLLTGDGMPQDAVKGAQLIASAEADGDYRAKLLRRSGTGRKAERSPEKIAAQVRRAARAGDADAMYTLAFMHLIGYGVPRDPLQEVRWYRAASFKNPRAAFVLSLMYHHGDSVPRNPSAAARLMMLAAGQGHVRAQYYAGTFCYHGIGVAIDRRKAAEWFRRSAEQGDNEAQFAYGMMLLAGDGIATDRGEALKQLVAASGQGNEQARAVVKELLTYHMNDTGQAPLVKYGVPQVLNQPSTRGSVSLEGKGLVLDQGRYGLKFSLPNLNDAYAPPRADAPGAPNLWQKLQGGTFEIIFKSAP